MVLSGRVNLRLECGVVRYPDHYWDEDGKEIWEIVKGYLEADTRQLQPTLAQTIRQGILA